MMAEHEQIMNKVKAMMQRSSGQTNEKQQANPATLPNISVRHNENDRPIVIGKDRISYIKS